MSLLYIFLTSIDVQEIIKIGGKVIQIYEGVIYRENFKISPFREDIEKLFWDVLDKANLVGKKLLQGRNDYKSGGVFYGSFLARKIRYVLTIDKY